LDEVIFEQELTNQDQKVIKNDCNRTRIKDQELIPEFKEKLEKYLVLYCKHSGIKYKQGLNEIFAPFLLLKAKLKNREVFNKLLSRRRIFLLAVEFGFA